MRCVADICRAVPFSWKAKQRKDMMDAIIWTLKAIAALAGATQAVSNLWSNLIKPKDKDEAD